MSGGEKQRIALLLLLIRNPDILILDEPTSFLDYENKLKIINIIKEQKQNLKTIIIATHNYLLTEIADELLILNDGILQITNKLQEIASALEESPWVKGTNPDQKFKITIPQPIYKQLETNRTYLIVQENSGTRFSITPVLSQKILKQYIGDIIILEANEFEIPVKFQSVMWKTSKIYCIISKTKLQIQLQTNS